MRVEFDDADEEGAVSGYRSKANEIASSAAYVNGRRSSIRVAADTCDRSVERREQSRRGRTRQRRRRRSDVAVRAAGRDEKFRLRRRISAAAYV